MERYQSSPHISFSLFTFFCARSPVFYFFVLFSFRFSFPLSRSHYTCDFSPHSKGKKRCPGKEIAPGPFYFAPPFSFLFFCRFPASWICYRMGSASSDSQKTTLFYLSLQNCGGCPLYFWMCKSEQWKKGHHMPTTTGEATTWGRFSLPFVCVPDTASAGAGPLFCCIRHSKKQSSQHACCSVGFSPFIFLLQQRPMSFPSICSSGKVCSSFI